MKQLKLLAVSILLSNLSYSQTINIQSGVSISKLDWVDINGEKQFNQTTIRNSSFIGIDYLDRKYFSVSSNLGSVTKGGEEDRIHWVYYGEDSIVAHDSSTIKATLKYVSINSTFNFKYPIKDKIIPFLNVGPRIDYLFANNFVSVTGSGEIEELHKYNFGLILGGGVKYDFSKVQIGVRADKYINFNSIGKFSHRFINTTTTANDKTFTINLSVGLKL